MRKSVYKWNLKKNPKRVKMEKRSLWFRIIYGKAFVLLFAGHFVVYWYWRHYCCWDDLKLSGGKRLVWFFCNYYREVSKSVMLATQCLLTTTFSGLFAISWLMLNTHNEGHYAIYFLTGFWRLLFPTSISCSTILRDGWRHWRQMYVSRWTLELIYILL